MIYTRRESGRLALAALPAAAALAAPNSRIKGVQIGAITYSFRQGVPKPEIIPDMVKIGLSEVELMSGDAEALAGALRRWRGAVEAGAAPFDARAGGGAGSAAKSVQGLAGGGKPATWQGVKKQFNDAGIRWRSFATT